MVKKNRMTITTENCVCMTEHTVNMSPKLMELTSTQIQDIQQKY